METLQITCERCNGQLQFIGYASTSCGKVERHKCTVCGHVEEYPASFEEPEDSLMVFHS